MHRHALAAVLFLTLGACGGDDDSGTESPPTVYAAASLTEAFTAIDAASRYSFAGSDELATQIREGAPADVYAAASSKYPQQLYDEGLVEKPVTFASNRLVLIVPSDNPAGITTVEDVAKQGTKLVVAAEGVPVGDYTRTVLDDLGLEGALENIVSYEDDVKGVLAKVSIGEADAGFVYATDVRDDVRVVELPERAQPPIEYQIAVVRRSERKHAAAAFVRKVLGREGQATLKAAGFREP